MIVDVYSLLRTTGTKNLPKVAHPFVEFAQGLNKRSTPDWTSSDIGMMRPVLHGARKVSPRTVGAFLGGLEKMELHDY